MAEIKGDNANTVQHNGEYGNGAVSILEATVNAAAVDDTIYLGDVAGGNEIYRATIYREALGTGVTLNLGYQMKSSADGSDDLTAFFETEDAATAGRAENAGDTVTIPDGEGAEIVATVKGATTAAEDRKVKVILERVYHGQ